MVLIKESKYLLELVIFVWLITLSKGQWGIDDHGCVTPDGGSGSCIPKTECQHVIDPSMDYNCGVTKNSVKICCPNAPTAKEKITVKLPTRIEVPSSDFCVTPDDRAGTCIPIRECKPITDFIQSYSPLSTNDVKRITSYQCGHITSSVNVCCPESPIVMEIVTQKPPDNTCQTPDNNAGLCIPVKECIPMTDFIHNSWPLTQDTVEILQGYQCGSNTKSTNVCCPENPITIAKVTTEPVATTEPPSKNECKTPDKNIGLCVAIKECKPIVDFIQRSAPFSPDAVKTLHSYECESTTDSISVCCPNDTMRIETLNTKTPAIVIGEPPDVTNHRNLNLLPYECGLRLGEPRIVGGNKTVLFEFPWMALLSYETGKGRKFLCGGTIINERYILTAAHCLTNLGAKKLIGVRVGEHNISSEFDCEKSPYGGEEYCAPPVQDIAIEDIIPHPEYNFTSITTDIGLIRLASAIDVNVDNAKPVCLPITQALRTKNFLNSSLTVTGWGNTEAGQRSADLLKVNVPVTTEENCREAYKKTQVHINSKQICAGGRNKQDSCGGDSGGPLQTMLGYNNDVRCVQFGVVSFGPKYCGQLGFPGVYTRVEYYMDWILDNMRP